MGKQEKLVQIENTLKNTEIIIKKTIVDTNLKVLAKKGNAILIDKIDISEIRENVYCLMFSFWSLHIRYKSTCEMYFDTDLNGLYYILNDIFLLIDDIEL